MISLGLFNLIISIALLVVATTPLVLIYFLYIDWKQKDLW
jgi:hypothetical protein